MNYHGTSTSLKIKDKILPPCETGKIQEQGRIKNLNKVFFTKDKGYAKIYAGRAKNVFGGDPIVFEVIPKGKIEVINNNQGCTVLACDYLKIKQPSLKY